MRFEIKYTKMQKLNERGIYNLQGLQITVTQLQR
jgi:hypothetical protein